MIVLIKFKQKSMVIEAKVPLLFYNDFLDYLDKLDLQPFEGVTFYQCVFNEQYYNDELFDHNHIVFPCSLNKAVIKRKSEFLAGRLCAAKCLDAFNVFHHNVGIGNHRQPLWPDGYLGSISHSKNKAMCAVTSKSQYRYLGIDIEYWMSTKTVSEVNAIVVDDNENKLLKTHFYQYEKLITLVFSAKESLFKAIYNEVGQYFGFEAAKVINIDFNKKYLELYICNTLSKKITQGMCFKCHFKLYDESVLTVVCK